MENETKKLFENKNIDLNANKLEGTYIDERISFWRNQLLMVNSRLFELYQQRLIIQNILQELELLKRREEQEMKLEEG